MPLSIVFSLRTGKRFVRCVHLRKRPFHARWRVPLSAFLAIIMLFPGGCGFMPPAVRGIPEEETTSVRAGQLSIVLFRLAPRLDNTFITPADKASVRTAHSLTCGETSIVGKCRGRSGHFLLPPRQPPRIEYIT